MKNGVKVITNEPSCEIVGDKELEGLRLSDGTVVSAKIMGVGIGTSTDKSLLTDAGIEVDRGILANEYLETSVENVYTAGDVAEFYDVTVDRRLRLGNWMNAMQQARAVVKTMAGERTKFELVSSYATNLLGLKVVFVGDVSRQHADEVIQHVDEEDRSTELFIRNGRLVGAVLLGDVLERQAITNAIKEKKMYDS
ncbi:FAD-dependent oxidoreductase [Patescibacteria group bacterium]|nr:FAD-dependent oxidoreductase [Patescibacteria group bacterium]